MNFDAKHIFYFYYIVEFLLHSPIDLEKLYLSTLRVYFSDHPFTSGSELKTQLSD